MTNARSLMTKSIQNNILLKKKILENEGILLAIEKISEEIISVFKNNGKLFLCGNGGSAADAQHLAAEFTGKFYIDRRPLDAEALHVNTSFLTAVANDYSYDEIFARLIRARGRQGDALIGLSTSGNSANVIKAIEACNDIGIVTIGFTGGNQAKMDGLCKYIIKAPSPDTPRIQEAHMLIGHIICEIVENELFAAQKIGLN